MKVILLVLALSLLAAWILWHSSVKRLLAWLGARPVGHFPVWRQVKSRLDELARRERLRSPQLYILPEFSPNALILRTVQGVKLALSEGLLRSLSNEELDSILVLCLAHGSRPRRGLQTWLSMQLFPLARFLQTYPMPVQVILAPWLTFILRAVSPQSGVLRSDSKVSQRNEALTAAAALQKMAVLGRKIPLRQWNFALDSLFLLSPLTLDGGPFWVFLSQPSVEARRANLLGSPACESAPSLP
jgi:Zn-dependent protease with chaperone function